MSKVEQVKKIVKHPKLYLAVAGKLQHVKPGSVITVSSEAALSLGSKLDDMSDQKVTKVGPKADNSSGFTKVEKEAKHKGDEK